MSSNNLRKIRKDFAHALNIINDYEKKLSGWQKNLSLDTKNIEKANIEQSSWLAYYDEIKVHLKTMVEYFEYLLKNQKAVDIRVLMRTSDKALTDRMLDKLAEDSQDYKDIFMVYLEVKELYLTADSIVNQLQQRAYALKNIVEIRAKELQGITLHLK